MKIFMTLQVSSPGKNRAQELNLASLCALCVAVVKKANMSHQDGK